MIKERSLYMAIYHITDHGKSNYHITVHQYADETVRFAASELQKYILQATRTAIPHFSDCSICPMWGLKSVWVLT